jgi:hypothetical protein
MPLVEVQSVLAFISRLSVFVAALSASGGYRNMTRWKTKLQSTQSFAPQLRRSLLIYFEQAPDEDGPMRLGRSTHGRDLLYKYI